MGDLAEYWHLGRERRELENSRKEASDSYCCMFLLPQEIGGDTLEASEEKNYMIWNE